MGMTKVTSVSSVSKANTVEKIGEFWDTHDFTEYDNPNSPDGNFTVRRMEDEMASTMSKKRLRKTATSKPNSTARRSSKVGDMSREELRDLLSQVIEERLTSAERVAPHESGGFDWIAAAREVRSRAPMSPDSTPLLRALREERAQR